MGKDYFIGSFLGLVVVAVLCYGSHVVFVSGYSSGREDARSRAARTCNQEKDTLRALCDDDRAMAAKECRARVEDRILNCEQRIRDVMTEESHQLDLCYEECRR